MFSPAPAKATPWNAYDRVIHSKLQFLHRATNTEWGGWWKSKVLASMANALELGDIFG